MRRIVIIGGGLAGLTLGVLLRGRSVPVELWDASGYPRHRVCGEFVSGAGAELLLELLPQLARQARPVETVRFFAENRGTPAMRLPKPGLAIPRWDLDHLLAERLQTIGGKIIAKQRWTNGFAEEGVVRATGRRLQSGLGWTGLKARVAGLEMSADLEMHFSDSGYLGIARLPEGANLCALVNQHCPAHGFREDPIGVFQRLVSPESAQALSRAKIMPGSPCAVTGISFGAQEASAECRIGDAMRMIPPFTGNGMSLAIESAALSAPALLAYSEGRSPWTQALRDVRRATQRGFRKRFAAASFLQSVASRSWTRQLMLSSFRTAPRLLPLCFGITR